METKRPGQPNGAERSGRQRRRFPLSATRKTSRVVGPEMRPTYTYGAAVTRASRRPELLALIKTFAAFVDAR